MTSLYASPTPFKLAGYTPSLSSPSEKSRLRNQLTDDSVSISSSSSSATLNQLHNDKGIVLVVNNCSEEEYVDPILVKLSKIPRFEPLVNPDYHPTVAARSLWAASPILSNCKGKSNRLDSRLIGLNVNIKKSLYKTCNEYNQNMYCRMRKITRQQAHLVSSIKLVESTAESAFTSTLENNQLLKESYVNITTILSSLHEEMAKTRSNTQSVFSSLRKVREQLDQLTLDQEVDYTIDITRYPNLHKLTYHHRPRSYHPQIPNENEEYPEASLRFSLDSPSHLRQFNQHMEKLPKRPSTSNGTNGGGGSLLANAIAKVQFATSKAYRHRPSVDSTISASSPLACEPAVAGKLRSNGLRPSISMASLKETTSNPLEHTCTELDPPLKAKDRLHKLMTDRPSSMNVGPGLSRWLPSMFKTESKLSSSSKLKLMQHGNYSTPNSLQPCGQGNPTSEAYLHSIPPTLPELDKMDYRIVLKTEGGIEIRGGTHSPNYLTLKDENRSAYYGSLREDSSNLNYLQRSMSASHATHPKSRRRPSLTSLLLEASNSSPLNS